MKYLDSVVIKILPYENFIDNLRGEQSWRDVSGLMELAAWDGERKKEVH